MCALVHSHLCLVHEANSNVCRLLYQCFVRLFKSYISSCLLVFTFNLCPCFRLDDPKKRKRGEELAITVQDIEGSSNLSKVFFQ